MPSKRATPNRSIAAAKSSHQPHGRKPVAKPTPVVADELDDAEDLAVEQAEGPRSATTVKISNDIAAIVLGIRARQLTSLRSQGCPVPPGGVRTLGEVAAIVKWRMDQQREALTADRDMDDDDLDREEKRTKLILLQTKISRELDHVLDADPYIHHLSVLWSEHNSLLDGMGRKLAPFLASMTDEEDIKDRIDEFVAGLKKRFNPDEAMKPVTTEHDPFTDDVVGVDEDDDSDVADDEDA